MKSWSLSPTNHEEVIFRIEEIAEEEADRERPAIGCGFLGASMELRNVSLDGLGLESHIRKYITQTNKQKNLKNNKTKLQQKQQNTLPPVCYSFFF